MTYDIAKPLVEILKTDPYDIFRQWYEEALTLDQKEANYMVLSTVNHQHIPSSRVVLLKGFDQKGFRFFTNLNSQKGRELQENPHVALNFYWEPLAKQIRIQGKAIALSADEADQYFASRPRGSRLGAWASKQSSTIENRDEFEKRLAKYEQQFEGDDIPRAPHWSGFRIIAKRIEFWQAGDYRLHDRLAFQATDYGLNDWQIERLYP